MNIEEISLLYLLGYKRRKMNTFNNAVIISAFRSDFGEQENNLRHGKLFYFLNQVIGLPTLTLKGSYKGIEETSIYAEYSNDEDLARLKDLAMAYGQESILHLDSNRNATLIFTDNTDKEVNLGQLVAVSESQARTKDAWTYNAVNNTFYITTK